MSAFGRGRTFAQAVLRRELLYPFEILPRGVASCVFRAAVLRAVLRLRPPLNQFVVK
jgi:hypothetical protein